MKYVIKTEKNYKFDVNRVYLGDNMIYGKEDEILNFILDIEYDTIAHPNGISFLLNFQNITATTSPYQKTAEELGFTEISDIARDYQTTPFTKINKFPTIAGGDCNEAFKGNTNIISLPVEWELRDMTRASAFLRNCTNLTSFDASKWKVNFATANDANCGRFVQGCSKLTYVDISGWDIQNCEWLDWMFAECPKLTTIKLNNIKIKELLNTGQRLDSMFKGDTALTGIYMNGCDCDTIQKIQSALTQSGIPEGQVTIYSDSGCPGTVPTPKNDELAFTYDNSAEPTMQYTLNSSTTYTADKSPFVGRTSVILSGRPLLRVDHMFSDSRLISIQKMPDIEYTMLNSFVANCKKLTYFTFDIFNNLDKLTEMSNMFGLDSNLTEINTDKLCAAAPTLAGNALYGTFLGCRNLASIKLNNLKTQNVTSIENLFDSCQNLVTIDISGWDLSKVTEMTATFKLCTKLTSITMNDCSCATIKKIKDALTQSGIPEGQVTIVTNTVCS